jgi:hypothetical protein
VTGVVSLVLIEISFNSEIPSSNLGSNLGGLIIPLKLLK